MRFLSIFLITLVLGSTVPAQENLPFRQNPPEEYITIGGDTPFAKAMEIFGNAFKRFIQKPLVYEELSMTGGKSSSQSTTIGINIPNMYWRDAFDVVLRVNNHWYFETPDYVRVYPLGGKMDTAKATQAIQTKAVEISAIFFEANRTALDQLGIDWSALWNGKSAIARSTTVNVGVDPNGSGSAVIKPDPTATTNTSSGSSGSSSGGAGTTSIDYGEKFGARIISGNLDLVATLKALQSENLGELISSPSVTVRSGEAGRIMVGQDFSVKQRDFSGNTVEKFYSAGTIIDVVPTIMTVDSIEFVDMKLSAERSSVFPDAVSTIINKTQATTSIVLLDGEETVVGGLFTNDMQKVRRGIPFLKDLPWWVLGLRYLFGYEEDQVTKKELIIIMKARIIKSVQNRVQDKMAEIKLGQQKALETESLRQKATRDELLRQIKAANEKKQ
jgi:general secretion pathway protein D